MLEFDDSISLADMLPFIEEKLSIGLERSNDTGQMQWSRGFYELFGLDPRQTGPSPAEIDRRIHPDDRGRWFDHRSLAYGMLEDEFRIIRLTAPCATFAPEPSRCWTRPASLNGCLGLLPMSRKGKTYLNIATERSRALARVLRGLVWPASCDGHISAFSDSDQSVAHVEPGSGWAELLHDKEREAVLREWQVSLETEQPYEVEARLRQADGGYSWHRCTAIPLGNGNGGVREWLGVWIDAHYDILAREQKGSSKLTGRQLRAAREC
ncbi:PAS domain-containing protein [Bradyrhizobium glycinis]|uniref:PAS domain-containing protein n=1 Tax=Bradyrhizobium glycinis TaxID=2751812 RepID=UPI001FEABC04|nr:PAS domain-containing protein [Bradyrhizobium glycinis]